MGDLVPHRFKEEVEWGDAGDKIGWYGDDANYLPGRGHWAFKKAQA